MGWQRSQTTSAIEQGKQHDNFKKERGQYTHGQGERVKIPLLPHNVGKKSVNDAGPQQGHDTK